MLRALLVRYALVLIDRGAQIAACIQHHSVEQPRCRWLLQAALRKAQDQFGVTQEFLSDMLGVRGQGINGTTSELRAAKLISHKRVEMTIPDRAGLGGTREHVAPTQPMRVSSQS